MPLLVYICMPLHMPMVLLMPLLMPRARPHAHLGRTGGGNPVVLCATFYMLLTSLPFKLAKLISAGEAGGGDMADTAANASADAGDDDAGGGGGGETASGEQPGALSGGAGAMAGLKVSKLMGRAFAAKEAAGKKAPAPKPEEEAMAPSASAEMEAAVAAARWKKRHQQHVAEEEADGGGDDD